MIESVLKRLLKIMKFSTVAIASLINEIPSNGILEGDLTGFLDACKKSLDYLAPRKRKYTRVNYAPFLTKEINTKILIRSRFRNKFLHCRSDENKKSI